MSEQRTSYDVKEETKTVYSDEWQNMSLTELYEQKSTLQDRLYIAIEMNNIPLRQQLQRGIDQLDALIRQKSEGDTLII